MAKINYADKVALNSNSDIADINKVNASDLNEIKNVVNENDDNTITNTNNIAKNAAKIGTLSSLNTTNKSNLVSAINEVNTNDIRRSTYSTNEIVIGKWINGKPIYRRTYIKEGTFTTEATITNYPENLDDVISFEGYAITDSNNWLPCPCSNSGNINLQLEVFSYNNSLRVGIGSSRILKKIIMILEYTKTTD